MSTHLIEGLWTHPGEAERTLDDSGQIRIAGLIHGKAEVVYKPSCCTTSSQSTGLSGHPTAQLVQLKKQKQTHCGSQQKLCYCQLTKAATHCYNYVLLNQDQKLKCTYYVPLIISPQLQD